MSGSSKPTSSDKSAVRLAEDRFVGWISLFLLPGFQVCPFNIYAEVNTNNHNGNFSSLAFAAFETLHGARRSFTVYRAQQVRKHLSRLIVLHMLADALI